MQPWTLGSRIALIAAEIFVWWLLALALQEQTIRPLQTLANVIGSLREEDYSFRARNAVPEDALRRGPMRKYIAMTRSGHGLPPR